MKKYFAIFAAVALLGMLAIYFVPDKQLTQAIPTATNQVAEPKATSSTPVPTQAETTTTPVSSSTSNAAQFTLKNGTFNGDSVQTRFGTIKVAITVNGGKITDVNFVALPSDDMRSEQISSQASPLLESQTITAQSAEIDGVSGATYTSQGYVESLQSAIDAARS